MQHRSHEPAPGRNRRSDRAGRTRGASRRSGRRHLSGRLVMPPNITLIPLPAKCPQLNPQENVWQFLRDNWLSNRIFKSTTPSSTIAARLGTNSSINPGGSCPSAFAIGPASSNQRVLGIRFVVELIDVSVSKKASKTPALLKRSKRFHTLFQGPKRSGSAPANVLDGEEMKRVEEAAIVLSLPPTARQAGAKHRKRGHPIVVIHLCRHRPRPPDSVGVYESCLIHRGNPKNVDWRKFVHTA